MAAREHKESKDGAGIFEGNEFRKSTDMKRQLNHFRVGREQRGISNTAPLPLSEPDKRISHTYGSSAFHSAHVRSTTWIQINAYR